MKKTNGNTRLLTVSQAAELLAISPRSLADRGWRYRLRIPTVKIGGAVRFDVEALSAWLRRNQERRPRDYDAIAAPDNTGVES